MTSESNNVSRTFKHNQKLFYDNEKLKKLIVPIPVGTERCKNAISTRLKHQINVKNNH